MSRRPNGPATAGPAPGRPALPNQRPQGGKAVFRLAGLLPISGASAVPGSAPAPRPSDRICLSAPPPPLRPPARPPASGLRVPESSAAPARGGERAGSGRPPVRGEAGPDRSGPGRGVGGVRGVWALVGFSPRSRRPALFWPRGSFMPPRNRGGYGAACQGGCPVGERRGAAKPASRGSGGVTPFRRRARCAPHPSPPQSAL